MKVYPDANIYVTYLLGQKGEGEVDKFFKQGLSCRFSIVASNTMFAEVERRCGNEGKLLLQKNIDDFKKAGKLEIVNYAPEKIEEAYRLVVETGAKYGRNDMLHAILAKKYANVFLTNDRNLAKLASKTQKAMGLEAFLASEL